MNILSLSHCLPSSNSLACVKYLSWGLVPVSCHSGASTDLHTWHGWEREMETILSGKHQKIHDNKNIFWGYFYRAFRVLLTTQSTLQYSFAIHTQIHTVHLLAALFWSMRGNLWVSILPKDTSACGWGRLGIELPTFWLEDERSTSQPQPHLPLPACRLDIDLNSNFSNMQKIPSPTMLTH